MAQCRSCDAEIIWIKTKQGKNMPCDPLEIHHDEANDGDVLVGYDGTVTVVRLNRQLPNVKGHVSHFATCPDAQNWRSTTKEGGK